MAGPLAEHQYAERPGQLVVDQRDQLAPGPLVADPGPAEDDRKSLHVLATIPSGKIDQGIRRYFPRDLLRRQYDAEMFNGCGDGISDSRRPPRESRGSASSWST